MIRLGWHRCKHCGLHGCKRRCDGSNRGTIEPGASPALERGAEALDRRGGVCTWCLSLRGSPARRRCAEPDLSLAPPLRPERHVPNSIARQGTVRACQATRHSASRPSAAPLIQFAGERSAVLAKMRDAHPKVGITTWEWPDLPQA
jgi:hypothetical protein